MYAIKDEIYFLSHEFKGCFCDSHKEHHEIIKIQYNTSIYLNSKNINLGGKEQISTKLQFV